MNYKQNLKSLNSFTLEQKKELASKTIKDCCSLVEYSIEKVNGYGSVVDYRYNKFGVHKVILKDVVADYDLPHNGVLHKILISITKHEEANLYQYTYDEKSGLNIETKKDVI